MTYQERIDAKANEIELLTAYANGVTGQEDSNIGDAVKTLCDGYGQGGGDTVYFSSMGQPYVANLVIPSGNYRMVRDHFIGATNLISFDNSAADVPSLDSNYGLFSGCQNMLRCVLKRNTFGQYVFRQCYRLADLTLGGIGCAVTSIDYTFFIADNPKLAKVTVYVSYDSVSSVPQAISSKFSYLIDNGILKELVYRNSTTGEILT